MADSRLSFFERYLSVWVALCILVGVGIGWLAPAVPELLKRAEIAHVSIPIAVLIWLMIYPMMLRIDFGKVRQAGHHVRGLGLTLGINWAIKPFSMAAISGLFFFVVFRGLIPRELATEYYTGAILLGAAPCTAMVFVWSYLSGGNALYTLVQVAVNDLVLIVLFAPIVKLLLGLSQVFVPYGTIFFSVVLYVVIPLTLGYFSRRILLARKGKEWFENVFLKRLRPVTIAGLLLTLVILFIYQGKTLIEHPLHIALIAIPLTIQTFAIFGLAYGIARLMKLPHEIAAPGAEIGASNFFELAVAAAVALFGIESGATLATVVGVLVEVPVMLALVRFANRTRHWFPTHSQSTA